MSWKVAPIGRGGDLLYSQAGTPSLDLRFAENKALTDYVSGTNLIDFTRASSGTYVGSDGLIKTAPVNKLLHSEDFSQIAWNKSNVSGITTGQLAPDNTNTAAKIAFTDVNSWFIYQDAGSVVGQPYIGHVYLKGSANATLGLRKPGLPNTTVGSSDTLSISVTTEWQKFEAITISAENTDGRLLIDGRILNGASVPAGFDLFIWHPQVEEGTTATAYIKTTSTINSAPRFDHDPTTGESLGLLVEESRTNIITYSEDLDNYFIQSRATLVDNATTSPDGSLNAQFLKEDASLNNTHYLRKTGISANTYSVSFYAKANGRNYVASGDNLSIASSRVVFNLSSGVVALEEVNISNSSIVPVGNGWYRCSYTLPLVTYLDIGAALDENNILYDGDNTSGIYLWGVQLEEGSFPTSYIPTEGTTVTRAADVASISGANFSSWYNQSEGTVFAEALSYPHPLTGRALVPFAYSDNSYNNRIALAGSTGTTQFNFDVVGSGSFQRAVIGTFVSSGLKAAGGYKATGSAGSLDGASAVISSTPNIPSTISQLDLGNAHDGTQPLNGHISRLTYWQTRLPDETLQTITQ